MNLIKERFLVTYTKPQVQRLLGQMNMYCYKPQPRDYRQSEDHKEQFSQRLQAVADVLGMGTKNIANMAIALGDESTFQLFCNNSRVWTFQKNLIRKVNTSKTKQNCFGFYAIGGKSLLIPIQQGNEETFLIMLDKIKEQHLEFEGIILIWDNHPAHLIPAVERKAAILGIYIVNLPTYSPNLNPIESLWKTIKEQIGTNGVIANLAQINQILNEAFDQASKSLSFAKKWIDDFWNPIFWICPIICSK